MATASIEIDPQPRQTSYGGKRDASELKYEAALKALVTNYEFENDRRYHAYKAKRYVYPNDELEIERLDTLHKLTEVVLGGKLHLAPIKRFPERILDIGTGTGSWAIEMADNYPYAEILGNDLSPIQPQWAPANVHFEVDDVEADWTYPTTFDYIHCRHMSNAIKDWPRLLSQCYEFTTPTAYTELTDLSPLFHPPPNNPPLPDTSILTQLNDAFTRASLAAGFDPNPGPRLEEHLKTAGFVDVEGRVFNVPVGGWAKDSEMKTIGHWSHLHLSQALEAQLYRLFTTFLGFSKGECDALCQSVRRELAKEEVRVCLDLYVAYGKRPKTLVE